MYSSANNSYANVIGSTNVTINNISSTDAGFRHSCRGKLHHSHRSDGLSRSRPRHTTADTRANTTGSISPPNRRAQAPYIHSTSAPIRLPESHIHRTPSELQLAQEQIKADFFDGRMYARLIYGMSHHCDEEERSMHPLTAKSLRGVVNTHRQDLSRRDEEEEQVPFPDLDNWEISYPQDETMTCVDGMDWDEGFKNARDASSSSVVSNSEEEEEDDFLFSLEM